MRIAFISFAFYHILKEIFWKKASRLGFAKLCLFLIPCQSIEFLLYDYGTMLFNCRSLKHKRGPLVRASCSKRMSLLAGSLVVNYSLPNILPDSPGNVQRVSLSISACGISERTE